MGHGRCIGNDIAKGFGYKKHSFVSSCLQSAVALLQCGVLVGISETSHLTQPLTQMFPAFHGVLGNRYPVISDLSPMGFFFSCKKCPILFSPLPTGEMILSGGKDGLVAVSSPRTGMTIRVLADHKGSPITVLQCTRKQVGLRPLPRCCAGLSSLYVTALWEAAAGWPDRSASLLHCPSPFFRAPSPSVTSVRFF